MNFYENYVRLCNSVGKSPSAVAIELKLGKPSVSRWKSGTNPRTATLLKIADYFGVTVEYLKGEETKKDPAGRQGREVHGAGDGTRTREYKLGKLGPYHLATPACVKGIIAHLFPFEKKHIFRHG